VASITGIGIH